MSDTKYELTDDDVYAINRVRSILHERFTPYPASVTDGTLRAVADITAYQLFSLLNYCRSHGGMQLTDEQVLNRIMA